jgi:hypothetical protein
MESDRRYVVYYWLRRGGGHWARGEKYSRAYDAQAAVYRQERLGRAATYEVEYSDEDNHDLAD